MRKTSLGPPRVPRSSSPRLLPHTPTVSWGSREEKGLVCHFHAYFLKPPWSLEVSIVVIKTSLIRGSGVSTHTLTRSDPAALCRMHRGRFNHFLNMQVVFPLVSHSV